MESLPEKVAGLHPPSKLKIFLEKLGFDIAPWDICPENKLHRLYDADPFLMGDWTAIGIGDIGDCQSWKRNPGWWRAILEQHSSLKVSNE